MHAVAATLSYITNFHPGFWVGLGAVIGAVMGSFIGCAAYRIPRGISLRKPPYSYCPACQRKLQAADLVPIFSYLALRGRCNGCHAPIGTQSLAIETAATLTGAAIAWVLVQALQF